MAEASNSIKTAKRIVGTPFPPGKSGNPSGRPKAIFNLGEKIREFLAQVHPKASEYNRLVGHQAVKSRLDVLLLKLEKDDPKSLMAYGYGKPIETHEIGGIGGEPVVFNIQIASKDLP